MERYVRSDLAHECGGGCEGEGVSTVESEVGGYRILRVRIKSDQAAQRIKKPKGLYVTLDIGDPREMSDAEYDAARRVLGVEIRDMAERMCRRTAGSLSVLVAGLGNAELTPDALGPATVRRISVTRHLQGSEQALLSAIERCELSAITPGVLGQTGMEAAELLRGAVGVVKPDLIIAIDALAARSSERLARTVQLSDSGISPGTGIGKARRALTAETLGVPVMALGVPTVVESNTLVCDTLHRAGYASLSDEMRSVLKASCGLVVAPTDIDLLVSLWATLLAGALERAFSLQEATI